MSSIAAILKQEITRLARKEIRTETDQLKKAVARYRSDIAALKRQNAELSQRLAQLEKLTAKSTPTSVVLKGETPAGARFRADGLKKLRDRLGLSAPALASILGVSPQTIYNWESKATRPNDEQLAKIVILRKMGKREVMARIAAMGTEK
jgi:DNA-binding transcriptional regulator YiaG